MYDIGQCATAGLDVGVLHRVKACHMVGRDGFSVICANPTTQRSHVGHCSVCPPCNIGGHTLQSSCSHHLWLVLVPVPCNVAGLFAVESGLSHCLRFTCGIIYVHRTADIHHMACDAPVMHPLLVGD